MVPEGWRSTTIGKHADLLTGFPFKSERYTEEDGAIRLIRGDNVVHGRIRWDDVKRWPEKVGPGMEPYLLKPGDVLLAMDRPWVKAGLKCAMIINKDVPSLLVQRVARLRGDDWLDARYLYLLFQTHGFSEYVKEVQTETAIPNISARQIRDYPVILPTVNEQADIVRIIGDWGTAIEQVGRLIRAKQRLKKSLVPQLLSERLRFPEYVKERWRERLLGEFLSESRIRGSDGSTARKLTIKLYGRGVLPKTEKIAGSAATQYFLRKTGQFIYSKLDFLNGAFGVVPDALDGYETTADLPAFDVEGSLNARWLLAYVCRENFYSRKPGLAAGGRKARRVNPDAFLKIKISVPSRAEQDKIIEFLDALDREINLLTRQADALTLQKKAIMQKLLTGQIRVKV